MLIQPVKPAEEIVGGGVVPRAANVRWARKLAAGSLLAVVALGSALAQTAPAQEPLISRDGGGVKPNVMLTMDDSGSMRFQHMPENTAVIGTYSVANPVGSNSVNFDPNDNGAQATLGSFFIGTIAGQAGTNNWRQRFMRSADTNTIYYNPEVRYLPWVNADGTRYAAASVSAAKVDPEPGTGGTVSLTNVRNLTALWCFQDSSSGCSSSWESFNPGLYYRLGRDASGNYLDPQTASNYTQFNINAGGSTTYTKYPERTDCAGSTCSRTEERQNFANWFVYYRSRVLLAKASVGEALYDTDDKFRFGYGRINKTSNSWIDGYQTRTIESGVRDYTATRKTELLSWLYAMPISGGTPLRRAMQDIGEYYSDSGTSGPWSDTPGTATASASQKTCRRAYHMLVTDGYWNDTVGVLSGLKSVGNVDNTDGATITGAGGRSYTYLRSRPYLDGTSDTLADYAMYYWNRDLRTGLANKVVPSAADPSFWQSMTNFTIGLGVRGTLNPATDLPALTSGVKTWGTDQIDDLWHAAVNSRGEYFSAKDPGELTRAIRSAVGQAVNRELREAGVAAAATVLEADNRKYIPKYQTAAWIGDVDAYELDANGQAGAKAWSAEAKLPPWSDRKIYTWDAGKTTPAGVTFTWSDMSAGNRTAIGSAGTQTMVDYIRGERSNESGTGYRVRSGVLGDFVNSNPVFAKGSLNEGYETLPTIGSSYLTFLTQKKNRDGVLYIGGNGGMLNGFLETKGVTTANDGKEIFAYVPRSVYPSLSILASQTYGTPANYHKYFVDGPLVEHDAHVKSPGASTASWRNYLVGSLGAGGKAVFALDITDPTALGASTVRWELSNTTDADLGYVTAPVVVGVLPSGKWVAIFGNGYSESATATANLFVVDLETGVAQKVAVDAAVTGNGLGGVAIQKNAAGQIVAAYAGDLKGKLWKFDYDATQTSGFSISTGAAIFAAVDAGGKAQPITQAPLLFDHSEGGPLVAFGTGRLLTTADATDTSVQTIYAVWLKPSDTSGPPYARSQLVSRSLSSTTTADGSTYFDVAGTAVNYATKRGWYIDLSVTGYDGLRSLYTPQRVGQTLALFSAAAPAQTVVPCDTAVGQGVNLLFPVETGKSADYCLFDTNGDGKFDSGDICNIAGYATPADGMDAILRSPITTCDSAYCRTKYSIQNTTGGLQIQERVVNPPVPPTGGGTTKDRIWRRIINPPIR